MPPVPSFFSLRFEERPSFFFFGDFSCLFFVLLPLPCAFMPLMPPLFILPFCPFPSPGLFLFPMPEERATHRHLFPFLLVFFVGVSLPARSSLFAWACPTSDFPLTLPVPLSFLDQLSVEVLPCHGPHFAIRKSEPLPMCQMDRNPASPKSRIPLFPAGPKRKEY